MISGDGSSDDISEDNNSDVSANDSGDNNIMVMILNTMNAIIDYM